MKIFFAFNQSTCLAVSLNKVLGHHLPCTNRGMYFEPQKHTPKVHLQEIVCDTQRYLYGITLDKVLRINTAICGLQNSIFGLMSFTPGQILSQMFGVKSSESTGLTPISAQTATATTISTTDTPNICLESFTSEDVMCPTDRLVQLTGLNPFAKRFLM